MSDTYKLVVEQTGEVVAEKWPYAGVPEWLKTVRPIDDVAELAGHEIAKQFLKREGYAVFAPSYVVVKGKKVSRRKAKSA